MWIGTEPSTNDYLYVVGSFPLEINHVIVDRHSFLLILLYDVIETIEGPPSPQDQPSWLQNQLMWKEHALNNGSFHYNGKNIALFFPNNKSDW